MRTEVQNERRDRRDLVYTLVALIIGILGVLFVAAIRMLSLLTPEGITVHAPINGFGSVAVGNSTALVTNMYLTSPDTNAISVAALIAEIVLSAASYVTIMVLAGLLTLRILRGQTFGRTSSNLITATSVVLLLATGAGVYLRIVGLNGAFAAVGEFELFNQQQVGNDAIPLYFIAAAIGTLGIAFRRGEKLQRDTEGLV